jgi:hypothetical protein
MHSLRRQTLSYNMHMCTYIKSQMQNNIFLYKKDESLELKYHFHKPAFYVWFAFVFVFHFKSAIYIYIYIYSNKHSMHKC